MLKKNSNKSNNADDRGTNSKDRSETHSKNSPAPSAKEGASLIRSDVEIVGTVKFKNDVVIDGTIEGEVTSTGSVTIGKEAKVKAAIKSKTVIVEGNVEGDIHASDRLELREDAEVTGDINAAVLAMEAGAVLVGNSSIGSNAARNGSAKGTTSQDQSGPKTSDRKERELANA